MATPPPPGPGPGPGDNKPTAPSSSTATGTAPKPDVLDRFWDDLPKVVNNCYTNKLWGVTLNTQDRNHAPTKVILKKFLKSVKGDVDKARIKLINAILWNQRYIVDEKLVEFAFPPRFESCSFVTCHRPIDGDVWPVVVMWNQWGGTPQKEFYRDKRDQFYPWRMAMVELAIRYLALNSITNVPRYEDPDPYTITQDKVTDGHSSFDDYYPGIFGQVEICGVSPVLCKTVNSIFRRKRAKNTRSWHLVDKPESIGSKYLPPVLDPYPDTYTSIKSGFKVHFGYTLRYQVQLPVTETDADSVDEQWERFVEKWQRRYEESAWWHQKYRELEAAGYYIDEKGIIQRHDIPGLPEFHWTTTLKEKLKWDPKPKPSVHPVEEEGGEEGADIKGKGKEKLEALPDLENPELNREVPSEEIETTDSSDEAYIPPKDAGKEARFSFEVGDEHLTLKDPRDYVPPSPPGGSGPSKVKDEQQQLRPSLDESTSSNDICKAAAFGTTVEQMDEARQHLLANESEGDGSEESLRKYWSSDESEHWKNIKKAKIPRAQAKKQQGGLKSDQPSSSEDSMPQNPAARPSSSDSMPQNPAARSSSPGKEAKPPKMYSIFDDSSSSGDEASKEPGALGKHAKQHQSLGPQPSSSTQPQWKFTLDPPHSDPDESASLYSQDVPTPTTFGQTTSPQRPSSLAPESKAKALMEYIKPPDTNLSGEESVYTQSSAQAQTSSEIPAQLEAGEEKPEEEAGEDSDSDSDESLNESSSD